MLLIFIMMATAFTIFMMVVVTTSTIFMMVMVTTFTIFMMVMVTALAIAVVVVVTTTFTIMVVMMVTATAATLLLRQILAMQALAKLFLSSITNLYNLTLEIQHLTGHRMIEIHGNSIFLNGNNLTVNNMT